MLVGISSPGEVYVRDDILRGDIARVTAIGR